MSVLDTFPDKWSGMQREWEMAAEMIDAIPAAPTDQYFFTDGAGLNAGIGKGDVAPTAAGTNALAQGDASVAGGANAFAQGNTALAGGDNSFAQGTAAQAGGDNSFAQGYTTLANSNYVFAQGKAVGSIGGTHVLAQGESNLTYAPATLVQGDTNINYGTLNALIQGSGLATGYYGYPTYNMIVQGSSMYAYASYGIAQGTGNTLGVYPNMAVNSSAIGSDNDVYSNNCFAQGDTNVIHPDSNSCFAQGYGNTISLNLGPYVAGYSKNNFVQGASNIVYRKSYGNMLQGVTNHTGAVYGEYGNYNYNFLQGLDNGIQGASYCFLQGDDNDITGTGNIGNFLQGTDNTCTGADNSYNFIQGDSNTVQSNNNDNNFLQGSGNSADENNSLLQGASNTVVDGAEWSFAQGENNTCSDARGFAQGYYAHALRADQKVFGSNRTTGLGHAQSSEIIKHIATSDDSGDVILSMTLEAWKAYSFMILVSAKLRSADEAASFSHVDQLAYLDAALAGAVLVPAAAGLANNQAAGVGGAAVTCGIGVDGDAVTITVTGNAGEDWDWTCSVRFTEAYVAA